jgi:dTDP-4-dehydrorhamnose 3,5-epimerase-like enzyme
MKLDNCILLRTLGDERGQLISLESHLNVPFDIKRVYYMFDMPEGARRGMHAHKQLEQLLICSSGSCCVLLDDGREKHVVRLDNPQQALFLGKMIWHEMYDTSAGCVLMVLASDYYDEEDYIRDYDVFLKKVNHD